MLYDDDWVDQTKAGRIAAVRKTIRPITPAELGQLGEQLFPIATDPWCERYHKFITDHKDAHFLRAETGNGASIIYCRESASGFWFLPGTGMGMIQPNGLKVLAEIVAGL